MRAWSQPNPGSEISACSEASGIRYNCSNGRGNDREHLRSTQCSTYDHDSFFGYAMNLKNGFGQIEPDCGNLLHGAVLLLCGVSTRPR